MVALNDHQLQGSAKMLELDCECADVPNGHTLPMEVSQDHFKRLQVGGSALIADALICLSTNH